MRSVPAPWMRAPMADEQPRQVGHLRLARGVLDHGGALGERGRHHEVLGAGHGDEVGGDARALEPAGPRLHVAVLDGDLRAQLLRGPSGAGRWAARRWRSRRAARRAPSRRAPAAGPARAPRRAWSRPARRAPRRSSRARRATRVLPSALGRTSPPSVSRSLQHGAHVGERRGRSSSTTGSAVSSAARERGQRRVLGRAHRHLAPERHAAFDDRAVPASAPSRRGPRDQRAAAIARRCTARRRSGRGVPRSGEPLGRHERGDGPAWSSPISSSSQPPGRSTRGRARDEAADHAEAVRPAVQRQRAARARDLAAAATRISALGRYGGFATTRSSAHARPSGARRSPPRRRARARRGRARATLSRATRERAAGETSTASDRGRRALGRERAGDGAASRCRRRATSGVRPAPRSSSSAHPRAPRSPAAAPARRA